MKFLPKNTLAYFNAAPQTHLHNLSGIPTAVFSAATLKYRENCGTTFPNDDAVTFYTLNHCASIVRKSFTENEPLPEWAREIMAVYTDVAMSQGERILHYILSITTREMRHLKSTATSQMWPKLAAKFGGQVAVDYLKLICSHGGEQTAVDKYMKHPPALSIGDYTKALAYAFHHGSWSASYGGHPWGNVTDACVAYLTGTTSMEMLVDTGYTLAHNGGPIFNKGMMYSVYDGNFMTILDVQRSGQLPDLMLSTTNVNKTLAAVSAVDLVKKARPNEFKGYVDWKLVDELRPESAKKSNPTKYQTLMSKQKGPKTAAKKIAVLTPEGAVVQVHETMTTLLGKKVKVVGTFQVYPHQSVAILERTEE